MNAVAVNADRAAGEERGAPTHRHGGTTGPKNIYTRAANYQSSKHGARAFEIARLGLWLSYMVEKEKETERKTDRKGQKNDDGGLREAVACTHHATRLRNWRCWLPFDSSSPIERIGAG